MSGPLESTDAGAGGPAGARRGDVWSAASVSGPLDSTDPGVGGSSSARRGDVWSAADVSGPAGSTDPRAAGGAVSGRPGGDRRVGVVVLTTGERPRELAAALASVHRQREVTPEVVVVVNSEAPDAPDRVRAAIEAPADAAAGGGDGAAADVGGAEAKDGGAAGNARVAAKVLTPGRHLGIPEGRNLGVAAVEDSEVVLFLDDDGELVGDDVLARASAEFAVDPTLAVLSLRIVDPDTGATQRRHVPRLRVGDATRSSWVTTFLGGASVVRVSAFREAGGLPARFFYAHEETSLAWRLLDRGYRIRYAAELAMAHPATPPARHAAYYRLTGRNRVLLARQHLPAPLAVVYVLLWVVLGVARTRGGRRALLDGFVEGLRAPAVVREPISWRTVWRMTRYGRPPLL